MVEFSSASTPPPTERGGITTPSRASQSSRPPAATARSLGTPSTRKPGAVGPWEVATAEPQAAPGGGLQLFDREAAASARSLARRPLLGGGLNAQDGGGAAAAGSPASAPAAAAARVQTTMERKVEKSFEKRARQMRLQHAWESQLVKAELQAADAERLAARRAADEAHATLARELAELRKVHRLDTAAARRERDHAVATATHARDADLARRRVGSGRSAPCCPRAVRLPAAPGPCRTFLMRLLLMRGLLTVDIHRRGCARPTPSCVARCVHASKAPGAASQRPRCVVHCCVVAAAPPAELPRLPCLPLIGTHTRTTYRV